jgi:hypothetical protein
MEISMIFGAVVVVWLGVITWKLWDISSHYNRLISGAKGAGLQSALDGIITDQTSTKKRILSLEDSLGKLKSETDMHIQKVGLVRYNPFSDTGGSQSFTLALLDSHNNGVVMTSLYARTGNRWYIKDVKGGKGVAVELSKEENEAVKKSE